MTTREIQRALQTIHRESLEQVASLQDRETDSDADWLAIFAAMESSGYVKPAPRRTTLTFASFTIAEQQQIEGYAQRLINEAHALCLRFQERCPMFRESDIDRDELFKLERWYRAQHRAVERLRRRRDNWEWVQGHIKRARSWLATTSAVRGLTARAAQARTDEQIGLLLERK